MEKRQQALYKEKSGVTDLLWFFQGENMHADKGSPVIMIYLDTPQKTLDKIPHLQRLLRNKVTQATTKKRHTTTENHQITKRAREEKRTKELQNSQKTMKKMAISP